MPWLLMPSLLALPDHQQPWHWTCNINGSLSSTRRISATPPPECWIMIENANVFLWFLKMKSAQQRWTHLLWKERCRSNAASGLGIPKMHQPAYVIMFPVADYVYSIRIIVILFLLFLYRRSLDTFYMKGADVFVPNKHLGPLSI